MIGKLLILILSISCSSLPKKEESSIIKKEDFVKVSPLQYIPSKDYYSKATSKVNVLSKETMNRSDHDELDDLLDESNPLNVATVYCYSKKEDDGIKILRSIYDKYQNYPSYWNQIGTCYLMKKEFKKASLYYNKALDVDSKYAPALNNIGIIYLMQKEDQKAILAFESSSKLNPSASTPYFNLATIYLRYSLAYEALLLFKKLYSENNKDPDILNGIATAYLFKNNLKDALYYYEKIPSKFLERADISINYAYTHYLSNNKKRAKSIFSDIDKNNLGVSEEYYREMAKQMGI